MNKCKYKVVAVIVDLTANPPTISEPREEIIDCGENELFADCRTIAAVERRYEAFWNYPNFEDMVHRATDKVKVLSVERVEGPSPMSYEKVSEVGLILREIHAKPKA